MSRVLPAELRTKKVNSLQGDLKSIAEELLAEKFGVEEEVVQPRAADPFPQEFGIGFNDAFVEPDIHGGPRFRGRRGIEVTTEPWSRERIARVEVSYPDERHLVDAFITLDEEIPSRRERTVLMGRRFFHEMMRDERFSYRVRMMDNRRFMEGARNVVGQIHGFDIVIMPRKYDNHCIVEDRF